MGNRIKDLTGQRFGKLLVQERCGKNKNGNYIWLCVCDCGGTTEVSGGNLQSKNIESCGCLRATDLTGRRFGRLLVKERVGTTQKDKRATWLCICDCGEIKTITGKCLVDGNTVSCGCYQKEIASLNGRNVDRTNVTEGARKANVTHGHTRGLRDSRTYSSYHAMKNRCCNPNATSYIQYGGRGIKICDRWLNSFTNFLADLGERPEGTTLDRIDYNGDYEPNNCKWSTPLEQVLNRRPCGAAENLSDETILKEFHKRFPEVNIDILAKRHSLVFAEHADGSSIQTESV